MQQRHVPTWPPGRKHDTKQFRCGPPPPPPKIFSLHQRKPNTMSTRSNSNTPDLPTRACQSKTQRGQRQAYADAQRAAHTLDSSSAPSPEHEGVASAQLDQVRSPGSTYHLTFLIQPLPPPRLTPPPELYLTTQHQLGTPAPPKSFSGLFGRRTIFSGALGAGPFRAFSSAPTKTQDQFWGGGVRTPHPAPTPPLQ